MTAAIFGLAGVVVGAVLAAAREYIMALRQERAATRANARLLTIDLERALEAIKDRLLPGRWLTAEPWADELSSDGWGERLNLLARTMRDEDWEAVARAFVLVDKLKRGVAARWEPEMRRNRAVAKELAEGLTQIEAALRALGHSARDVTEDNRSPGAEADRAAIGSEPS